MGATCFFWVLRRLRQTVSATSTLNLLFRTGRLSASMQLSSNKHACSSREVPSGRRYGHSSAFGAGAPHCIRSAAGNLVGSLRRAIKTS